MKLAAARAAGAQHQSPRVEARNPSRVTPRNAPSLAKWHEAQCPVLAQQNAAQPERKRIASAAVDSKRLPAQRIVNCSVQPCCAPLNRTGRNMPAFTLGTASQATGHAKSTILRAIKAGRISAVRDDLGQWQIEPAELFRVFPALALPGATPQTGKMERDATTDALVAELRAVIADLRQERDHWRAAHEREQAAHAREQAAHATTQRLLLPPPATAAERDAMATGEGTLDSETPCNRLVRAWRWMRATG
jgi:hypothetical protein